MCHQQKDLPLSIGTWAAGGKLSVLVKRYVIKDRRILYEEETGGLQ